MTDYESALAALGEELAGTDASLTTSIAEIERAPLSGDGKRIVIDGPFIESKEVIGGYYVIDVANLDEALDWAAKIPNAHFGTVEVRPVMGFEG